MKIENGDGEENESEKKEEIEKSNQAKRRIVNGEDISGDKENNESE